MKHLLGIDHLSHDDCLRLVQRALQFKSLARYPNIPGYSVANLFYEPSTRTRVSFEMAEQNLGIRVINVDFTHSSETKGEIIEDTVRTLRAMGIQLFVMRHAQNGYPHKIAEGISDIQVINAGDGTHEHPSQALLDLMTIKQHKLSLEKLKIAIVGDIAHSRVANSLQKIFALMGVQELCLVAPAIWHVPSKPSYGLVTSSLQEGLSDADVVIALRVQKERLQHNEIVDLTTYHRDYALTVQSLKWAKPNALIMHPGPMNRGIEITSEVADGPQSCILEQVKNGVYMRMAILEMVTGF